MTNKIILAILAICPCVVGCFQDATKEDVFSYWKNHVNLQMVVTDKSDKQRDVTLYGRRIDNNHDTTYMNDTGYLLKIYDQIQVGDTIIKDKGKYTLHIKNKNGTKEIPFEYAGNEIADTPNMH
jgi:hypothetical protein